MLQTAIGVGLRYHIIDIDSKKINIQSTSDKLTEHFPKYSCPGASVQRCRLENEGRLGVARARDRYERLDTLQYIRATRLPRLSSRGTRLLAHGAMDGRDAPTRRRHGIPG